MLTRWQVGHAGTLDPLATGLLVLCVGSGTKWADHYTVGGGGRDRHP